jgi:fluoroacetyl-CoA thioesterase
VDLWAAPIGEQVALGDLDLIVTARQDDLVELHGSGVTAEVRRAAHRLPVLDGYLDGPIPLGAQLAGTFTVEPAMVTHHIPRTEPVLMTPTLVGLMEEVCARIVRPRLTPDAAAVGTSIHIRHTGAARLGEEVKVTARVVTHQGRRIDFDVVATVDGRPVGHGRIGFTLVTSSP